MTGPRLHAHYGRSTDTAPVEPAVVRPAGAALLVADLLHRDYLCRWYDGPDVDVLRERARAPSAVAAVRWALARSSQVRIEVEDGHTYWAGVGPVPKDLDGRWTEEHR